jgi:hypothetical protein
MGLVNDCEISAVSTIITFNGIEIKLICPFEHNGAVETNAIDCS